MGLRGEETERGAAGNAAPVSRWPHPRVFPSLHRLQLVPALDGCVRRDSWLDHQAQTSVSALSGSPRSCGVESQPGSFFPPGAHAEFSLQGKGDLSLRGQLRVCLPLSPSATALLLRVPSLESLGGSLLPPDLPQPHAEPWAFSLDLGLQLAAGSGHLLALGTPENPPRLSLQLQDQVRGVLPVFSGAWEWQEGRRTLNYQYQESLSWGTGTCLEASHSKQMAFF